MPWYRRCRYATDTMSLVLPSESASKTPHGAGVFWSRVSLLHMRRLCGCSHHVLVDGALRVHNERPVWASIVHLQKRQDVDSPPRLLFTMPCCTSHDTAGDDSRMRRDRAEQLLKNSLDACMTKVSVATRLMLCTQGLTPSNKVECNDAWLCRHRHTHDHPRAGLRGCGRDASRRPRGRDLAASDEPQCGADQAALERTTQQ
ncbi:hypothetical protein L1887_49896 [Cichorium endivia]|nr:hypothetical protein L1887_49896 [Cichorium endivia]